MATADWRPLSVETVGDWAELTNLLAVADGTEEFYDAMALAEELHEPGVEPELDTVGAWRDGVLVGFGQLRVSSGLFEGRARAEIIGGVRPDQRGQGLGTEIMNRMEARALELAAQRHPGVPVQLRVSGGLEGASVRPMLERRGYSVVRYYHEMARPIPGVLPEPPRLPVRRYSAELAEELRLAHNDAFSTHWGSVPATVEHWQSMLSSRTFRPDCSYLSLDSDGRVLSYVVVCQWVAGEAWVHLVGTRQEARGAGLARACLSAAVRAMAEQGFAVAGLGVDSENASGAGALYVSLGFELQRVIAHYGRVEPVR
ncbi:MAG: mycothiol synthase [Blastocatellia bacterium]|nr:mycothiol synthase [Blastocatellia bacterium]